MKKEKQPVSDNWDEFYISSQNYLTMTLKHLPQKVFLKNRKSVYISCNKNFARNLNIEPENINGKTDYDLFSPEIAKQHQSDDKRIMEAGNPEEIEEKRILNGKETWIRTIKTPVLDATDNAIGILGIFWDITEQKRIQQALLESQRLVTEFRTQFSRLFEEAHDSIFIFDLEGYFLDINQKATEILGYTEEEFKSMTIWDLLRPSEISDSKSKLQTILRGEKIPVFERTLVAKDGSLIPFENSVFTVKDENGQIKFIQSILRDLRERKEAEKKLQKSLNDLERSNEELLQIVYVTSHDLQEPLRMVASFTQLLEKRYSDQLDDTAREFIQFAVDGANRMQNLINALLMYSRVRTCGKPFQSIDCMEVLGQALINLKQAIEENHAIVTNDELPTVIVDEDQLVQLFQNLISNALKFRKDDLPHIHISAIRSDEEIIFSIQDNGIGIDPAYQEKIFIIFQRLNGHRFPGTGIGLAICKKIVERHAGRIWVESEPGKGSTFYFTIPLKEVTPNE
jgi:PAS domain S-box-containing protein